MDPDLVVRRLARKHRKSKEELASDTACRPHVHSCVVTQPGVLWLCYGDVIGAFWSCHGDVIVKFKYCEVGSIVPQQNFGRSIEARLHVGVHRLKLKAGGAEIDDLDGGRRGITTV
jgi:hypothetical protein